MADKKTPKQQQAFPRAGFGFAYRDEGYEIDYPVEGMELRDYFAIRALSGMLASPPIVDRSRVDKKKWAGIAYQWADAMMDARDK